MKAVTACLGVVAILSLGGCATYVTVMQNPETGDIQECQSAGAGLIPMAMASSMHDDCVEQLTGMGYRPVPGSSALE